MVKALRWDGLRKKLRAKRVEILIVLLFFLFSLNEYANGWLINETGNLLIRVEYETQSLISTSIIASVILARAGIVNYDRWGRFDACKRICNNGQKNVKG